MMPRAPHAHRKLAALLALGLLAATPACNPGAAEGASCHRANGNADCAAGLVCRAGIDIAAGSPRCCPRPPDKPSSAECAPAIQHFNPDPSVSPYEGAGGKSGGSGGSAGSDAGSAGSGGSAGSDAGSAGSPADAGID